MDQNPSRYTKSITLLLPNKLHPLLNNFFCFQIRQVANIQKYSVQCVLVINIFNEKIFILLWFWYIILAISTACSFLYWCSVTIFASFGESFIKANLELSDLELRGRSKFTDALLNRNQDKFQRSERKSRYLLMII